MWIARGFNDLGGRPVWAAALGLFLVSIGQFPLGALAKDQTFELLQIGTRTYTNVTVTTKETNYIFIVHSGGMTSVKLADLSPEVRASLGYDANAARARTNLVALRAREAMARIEQPLVRALEKRLAPAGTPPGREDLRGLIRLHRATVWGFCSGVFFFYVLFCLCCKQICRRAGGNPGLIIWLPIANLAPLFRAAGLSAWWGLACLVPGLNVAALVLWSIKIAPALGKGIKTTIFLLLPGFNFLAFVYLAFGAIPAVKPAGRVQLMTLKTV